MSKKKTPTSTPPLKTDSITPEEFQNVQATQNQLDRLRIQAETAALKVESETAKYENLLLRLYIKYGLTFEDKIDLRTGKIAWKEEATEAEKEEPNAE